MTTLFDSGADRSQIHALVIGVDHYPFAGAQAGGEDPWRSMIRDIDPLTCAVPSAREMVRWLVERRELMAPSPVGSIEVLLSSREPQRCQTGTDDVEVEPATFANARNAFDRWRERCQRRSDNIAVFSFCGHGYRIDGKDLLLFEDFGEDRYAPFDRALDFSNTHLAMRRCVAQIQCYFIDACRAEPKVRLGEHGPLGRAFHTPGSSLAPRDNPVIYSTPAGAVARGEDGVPTRFTKALLQALDGRAAVRHGPWQIQTDLLVRSIRLILEWDAEPGEQIQHPVGGGEPKGGPIRTLAAAPEIPFRLGLDPRTALMTSRLRLVDGEFRLDREPMPAVWEGQVPAGGYRYHAEPGPGSPYPAAESGLPMVPPQCTYDLTMGTP